MWVWQGWRRGTEAPCLEGLWELVTIWAEFIGRFGSPSLLWVLGGAQGVGLQLLSLLPGTVVPHLLSHVPYRAGSWCSLLPATAPALLLL